MPIQLTDEMKTAINNARADGVPMLVASVDATGQPSVSIRGSLQTYGDDRLAVWVRNADGGLLKSIAAHPLIALWYRNPAASTAFLLHGEARRVDDPEVRTHVYDHSPEGERDMDPERKGVAVVVDLIRVIQRGQVVMSRD